MTQKGLVVDRRSITSAQNGKLGGRPKGGKNQATIERELAFEEYRKRVVKAVPRLVAKQLSLAIGSNYLYRIDKEEVTLKDGTTKFVNKPPVKVTDENEILEYLTNLSSGDITNDQSEESAYYFITTDKGSSQAIDAMLDRTFGRAKTVVVTEDEEGNQKELQSIGITFIAQDGSSNDSK